MTEEGFKVNVEMCVCVCVCVGRAGVRAADNIINLELKAC